MEIDNYSTWGVDLCLTGNTAFCYIKGKAYHTSMAGKYFNNYISTAPVSSFQDVFCFAFDKYGHILVLMKLGENPKYYGEKVINKVCCVLGINEN